MSRHLSKIFVRTTNCVCAILVTLKQSPASVWVFIFLMQVSFLLQKRVSCRITVKETSSILSAEMHHGVCGVSFQNGNIFPIHICFQQAVCIKLKIGVYCTHYSGIGRWFLNYHQDKMQII